MSKHIVSFFWFVVLPMSVVILAFCHYIAADYAKSAAEWAMVTAWIATHKGELFPEKVKK